VAVLLVEIGQPCFKDSAVTCIVGKVKVKFSLEQAMKAQRGSRGIAVLFI
jgi:hypothetical protein